MSPQGNKELGKFIRQHREAVGLTLRGLSEQANVNHTYILKIERGEIDSPAADKLLRIAAGINVEAEDLYALAGYVMPDGLPEFRPYLRTKYPDLTQKEVRELERFFKTLREDDGGKR